MYELEVRCDHQVPRMGGGGTIPKIGIWWVVRLVGKSFSFRQGKISFASKTHTETSSRNSGQNVGIGRVDVAVEASSGGAGHCGDRVCRGGRMQVPSMDR